MSITFTRPPFTCPEERSAASKFTHNLHTAIATDDAVAVLAAFTAALREAVADGLAPDAAALAPFKECATELLTRSNDLPDFSRLSLLILREWLTLAHQLPTGKKGSFAYCIELTCAALTEPAPAAAPAAPAAPAAAPAAAAPTPAPAPTPTPAAPVAPFVSKTLAEAVETSRATFAKVFPIGTDERGDFVSNAQDFPVLTEELVASLILDSNVLSASKSDDGKACEWFFWNGLLFELVGNVASAVVYFIRLNFIEPLEAVRRKKAEAREKDAKALHDRVAKLRKAGKTGKELSDAIAAADDFDKQTRSILKSYEAAIRGFGKGSYINILASLLDSMAGPHLLPAASFDAKRGYITVANGSFDLNKLRPDANGNQLTVAEVFQPAGNPANHATRRARASFNPGATCPDFDSAVRNFFENDEDRRWIQKWAGAVLMGNPKQLKTIALLQTTHPNGGKTSIGNALAMMLGDTCAGATADPVSFRPLACRQKKELVCTTPKAVQADGNAPTLALSGLRGHLFAFIDELETGLVWQTSVLKQLTGEETLKARALYQNEKTFLNTCALMIGTNSMPYAKGDTTAATAGRLAHFVSDAEYVSKVDLAKKQAEHPERRFFIKDTQFDTKVFQQIDGVLRWALEGCRMFLAEGEELTRTTNQREVAESEADSDILCQFAADVLANKRSTVGKSKAHEFVAAFDVWTLFKDWCFSNSYEYANRFGTSTNPTETFEKALYAAMGIRQPTAKDGKSVDGYANARRLLGIGWNNPAELARRFNFDWAPEKKGQNPNKMLKESFVGAQAGRGSFADSDEPPRQHSFH